MVSTSRRKAVVHACWAEVMVRKNQSSVTFGLATYPSSETLMARRTFLMFLLLLQGKYWCEAKARSTSPRPHREEYSRKTEALTSPMFMIGRVIVLQRWGIATGEQHFPTGRNEDSWGDG